MNGLKIVIDFLFFLLKWEAKFIHQKAIFKWFLWEKVETFLNLGYFLEMQILDLLCYFIQVLFLKMTYLGLLSILWWGVLKRKKEIILRCIWLIIVWRCIKSIGSASLLFLKFPKIISRYANLIAKVF